MLVAQTIKCLLTMREIQVQSLGQEDSLEKGMATHSSILASTPSPCQAVAAVQVQEGQEELFHVQDQEGWL